MILYVVSDSRLVVWRDKVGLRGRPALSGVMAGRAGHVREAVASLSLVGAQSRCGREAAYRCISCRVARCSANSDTCRTFRQKLIGSNHVHYAHLRCLIILLFHNHYGFSNRVQRYDNYLNCANNCRTFVEKTLFYQLSLCVIQFTVAENVELSVEDELGVLGLNSGLFQCGRSLYVTGLHGNITATGNRLNWSIIN